MALWFSRCLKNILEYTGFIIDFKTRPCHVEVRGSREEELLFQFLFLIQHSCHIGSKVESRVQIFIPGQLWSWEQKSSGAVVSRLRPVTTTAHGWYGLLTSPPRTLSRGEENQLRARRGSQRSSREEREDAYQSGKRDGEQWVFSLQH